MTDKPILFNAAMVNAILGVRKTQTRRMLKPQPESGVRCQGQDRDGLWLFSKGPFFEKIKLPYQVGDRLIPAMVIPSLNRNYCADVFGKIWSRAVDGETWLPLAPGKTSRGYLSVTPAHDGKYKTRAVHRLVAEAFYGLEPNGLKLVRHLDGGQINNAPENLDWGTHEDNWSDRLAHGRKSGEEHHAAKLKEKDVRYIRGSDKSQRELARHFSVRQSTIWQVKNNLSWRENPIPNPPNCARWASRLTLVVTDVRVQRLQEINDADAMAEGIREVSGGVFDYHEHAEIRFKKAVGAFKELWDSINDARGFGWDANPWVVAVTFETHKCNIDQLEAEA